MSEETIQEQVIARAMKDPAFRQALLGNPRAVLAEEYHVYLAEEVSIRVLEEPPNTFTLVVPAVEKALLDLSDAELEAVSGAGTQIPAAQVPKFSAGSSLKQTLKGSG